ncbi:MAG: hypothetical protein U0841_02660 [Chloroflexia bacterium]
MTEPFAVGWRSAVLARTATPSLGLAMAGGWMISQFAAFSRHCTSCQSAWANQARDALPVQVTQSCPNVVSGTAPT